MNAVRFVFRLICLGVLVLAAAEIAFISPAKSSDEVPAHATKPAEPDDHASNSPGVSIVAELENKRQALDARERALNEHETRIKDREKDLDKKIQEMERLRAAVSGELETQKKNNEERVTKLVSVFETMTPKSASGVFETLDDWLAVEALKRMDVKRVAKVMNLMDKARSAKLSEMLTGYYKAETDRKISSIKPAGQAATAAASQAPPAASQPEQSPQKLKRERR